MSFELHNLVSEIDYQVDTDDDFSLRFLGTPLAHTSWFFPRLESIISSIPPSSHLSISVEIHVTSASPSPTSSASTRPPTLPIPPRTSLHSLGTRPSLSRLVTDSINKILSPCSFCYPICRCGDDPENQRDGEGICGNTSTDCVGNLESGNTRGVLLEIEEDAEVKEKRGKGELINEITELDQLPSCCQPQVSSNQKVGCCSNEPERKKCCSYPPDATVGVRGAPTPLRVRNRGGGMYVTVCGPTRMTVRFPLFSLDPIMINEIDADGKKVSSYRARCGTL